MDAVPFKLFKLMGGDGWGFNGWQKMIKEYIKVQLADLIPHARNPRKNDGAVDAVSKSINETGYITPIIIDEKNEILCGHTRAKSLKKLGHSEVDVLKVTGLTDEQKKRYRILDNKTGEVAEWDFEILQEDFKLEELVDLGFDIKDLDQGEVIEDEAPPIPETPKTVKGDIYELNGHRVMCGDSTILSDVEKLMDGKEFDVCITDPPYNFNNGGGGYFGDQRKNIVEKMKDLVDFDPTIFQFLSTLKIGSFYIFCNKDLVRNYLNIFENFKYNILIWKKSNSPPMTNNTFYPNIEYVMYFHNGNRVFNNELKEKDIYSKVFESSISQGHHDGANKDHPTPKPLELISKYLKISSKDNCIDFFLGSGSTLIACEQTGRTCYGIELDEKYVDVSIQRWVNFTKQTKIKRNGIEIEWPINNEKATKNA